MDCSDGAEASCLRFLTELISTEVVKEDPDIVRVSLALGIVESALASKKEEDRIWPLSLQEQVENAFDAFNDFVQLLIAATQSLGDSRTKVKAVADGVWSKLEKRSFSKDILHAQHVYNFSRILITARNGERAVGRHLDCAGVTTTTYAACRALGIPVYMQISEDHCFLNLDSSGSREGSVEVTTDSALRRGLAASEESWAGWLYAGGHAVICSPKHIIASLVTSMNPILASGKKATACDRLRSVQLHLLSILREIAPSSLYPAALCALADLKEEKEEDAMEAALASKDSKAQLGAALVRRPDDATALFEEAIRLAAANEQEDYGWQWYPYSYIVGFLCRRAEFLLKWCGEVDLSAAALYAALQWAAKGSGVLTRYRFHPNDEELYKDVGEGTLEYLCDGLRDLVGSDAPTDDSSLLTPLLTYWDGVCVLFSGRSKPVAWMTMVLKAAKLFTPKARASSAKAALSRGMPMKKAQRLWEALKPSVIRPLFEAPDVDSEGERASKRVRVGGGV